MIAPPRLPQDVALSLSHSPQTIFSHLLGSHCLITRLSCKIILKIRYKVSYGKS